MFCYILHFVVSLSLKRHTHAYGTQNWKDFMSFQVIIRLCEFYISLPVCLETKTPNPLMVEESLRVLSETLSA